MSIKIIICILHAVKTVSALTGLYTEPSLHPRDEFHLVTAYDSFTVLLNSFERIWGDFCISVHWEDEPVAFL